MHYGFVPPKFVPGVNDMATTHPDLAAELVGTDPTTVMAGTGKTLLWQCPNHKEPYPQTGRRRVEGINCGYCSGDRILPGFNDMATTHPHLAKELVGTNPTTVTAHTHSMLLWHCPNHAEPYPSKGNDRANGRGCGFCSGKRVLPGFNDIATTHPQLAAELVGTDPTTVLASTSRKLKWRCPRHETPYDATGESRVHGSACNICGSRRSRQVLSPGINDLATTHPRLAKELVGSDPVTIRAGSKDRLLWSCPNHTQPYLQSVRKRAKGSVCPYCSNQEILAGFNDMATTRPDLAEELVDTDPTTVIAGTGRTLKWRCPNHSEPYPSTGKARVRGRGCTYCNGNRGVLPGFNDMATTHPHLAEQLVGTDPTTIRAGTGRKLLWSCPRHEEPFAATGGNRLAGWGCGYCANRQILIGYNDLATTHEALARELVDSDPTTITAGSNSTRKWKCYRCGHTWKALVANRARGSGCAACNPGGFNPSKPGYLYLLEQPGEQQIGITGHTERRLNEHRSKGDWTLIDVLGPFGGLEAVELERELKKWLKANIGVLSGTQENWSTANFEVRTLSQLMALASVKPPHS